MVDHPAILAAGGPSPDVSLATQALDWASATRLRSIAVLTAIALVCFLPGLFSIPPVDRDEARFAQATKQMLETGNFVDIRLQDEPRYKKPVGIYWLQAAVVTLSGHGAEAPIGFYRLASVLGALAAVLLTWWAVLPLFGRQAALVAGTAMALSLILTVEAHLAKTDAVLLATVVLAQGALARAYLFGRGEPLRLADVPASGRPPVGTALLFWVGIGLGVLIKGPVILMVSGLTILALVAVERRGAWVRGLRPLIGVPLALAIILPWLIAIVSVAGSAFFSQSIGQDLFAKVGSGAEGHWAPPGTHLLLFFVIFFPAITLVPAAVPFVWRNRGSPAVRFCLAWLLPSWVVFEAVSTKLPHYTLPLYPAIAALVGGAVVASLATHRWWTRAAAVPPALFAAALPIAGLVALQQFGGAFSLAGIPVAIVIAAVAAAAMIAGLRDRPLDGAALLGLAAIGAYVFLFTAILPRLEAFHVSPRLAEAIRSAAPCPDPKVFTAGYQEPSLVFLVGTDLAIGNGREAAKFLAEGGCKLALVEDRQVKSFRRAANRLGIRPEQRTMVSGINIGSFRDVNVAVIGALPALPGPQESGGSGEGKPVPPAGGEK